MFTMNHQNWYKKAKYEDFDIWEDITDDHKNYLIEEMFDQGRIDANNPDETFEGLNKRVKRPKPHKKPSPLDKLRDMMNKGMNVPQYIGDGVHIRVRNYIKDNLDTGGQTVEDILLDLADDAEHDDPLMAQAAVDVRSDIQEDQDFYDREDKDKLKLNDPADEETIKQIALNVAKYMDDRHLESGEGSG